MKVDFTGKLVIVTGAGDGIGRSAAIGFARAGARLVVGLFDAIAHCGAISGAMTSCGRPMEIVAANVVGTANVLELVRIAGIRRIAFCSSISVYGDPGDVTLTEWSPLQPSSVYGAAKVVGEQLLGAFAREYRREGVSLRIGRVYGSYRRGDCVIKRMSEDSRAGRIIPCAPGFIYHSVWVDDVARAIAAALTVPTLPSRSYNIGSGEAVTMPDIAALAQRVLPGLVVNLVPGADDVPDVQTGFDVSRAREELGFSAGMRLAEGIAAYAARLPEPMSVPA